MKFTALAIRPEPENRSRDSVDSNDSKRVHPGLNPLNYRIDISWFGGVHIYPVKRHEHH